MQQDDTIFALSTPPGKSGVAVVRLSGAQAAPTLLSITRKSNPPTPRQAILSPIYASDGTLLDRALVLYFKAPHSFTGEDIVELHLHGGAAIIRSVMDELAGHQDMRPAEPGEFMRRAFYNEKADLLEAEAIADMIDAETSAQLAQAARQMQGHHSDYFRLLRYSMVEILALLEAYIDFPEEEIPDTVLSSVSNTISDLRAQINQSLNDQRIGERIRSGFHMAIIGAPNVGKSTLLNALSGRDAAIVSAQAGTTRDVIEIHLDIDGYPVLLCDTAGIHASDHEVEKLGIERSFKHIDMSDILLVVMDAAHIAKTSMRAVELINNVSSKEHPPLVIGVLNKCDQLDADQLEAAQNNLPSQLSTIPLVTISALSSDSLQTLSEVVKDSLDTLMPKEDIWVTRSRHRELLESSSTHLSKNIRELPLELFCEEIRLAAVNIGKITGEIVTDELLDVIFSRFCIGK